MAGEWQRMEYKRGAMLVGFRKEACSLSGERPHLFEVGNQLAIVCNVRGEFLQHFHACLREEHRSVVERTIGPMLCIPIPLLHHYHEPGGTKAKTLTLLGNTHGRLKKLQSPHHKQEAATHSQHVTDLVFEHCKIVTKKYGF